MNSVASHFFGTAQTASIITAFSAIRAAERAGLDLATVRGQGWCETANCCSVAAPVKPRHAEPGKTLRIFTRCAKHIIGDEKGQLRRVRAEVLLRLKGGLVAHECTLDLRAFKSVTAEDAMISIHAEMTAAETGAAAAKNNLLKNAPHTADQIASDNWNRPYTRKAAAFPATRPHDDKFWPRVGRVDNVFGDRNSVCSCVGMENYSA